ncbi:hypothetical protein [Leifsonia sp. TF02-11]|uniref:hypothetical protein n=1 Tax=Leifsonia sp. TF02-11 TaxID=2815212 RepID=UPI001AA113F3|nr:hypothetical protein [Leifsonia sp. TF02-11]MBN9629016.1 hypothetical protein [Actinomycetota bacterium]MBO1738003.1 hypothetical protein [Leifsonia sp. TF02-11]
MSRFVATLLPVGEDGYPQVIDIPMPAGETELPARLRLPIDTPDGRQFEVWELAERTGRRAATYRLARLVGP